MIVIACSLNAGPRHVRIAKIGPFATESAASGRRMVLLAALRLEGWEDLEDTSLFHPKPGYRETVRFGSPCGRFTLGFIIQPSAAGDRLIHPSCFFARRWLTAPDPQR